MSNNTATAVSDTVDVFGGGLLNEGKANVVSCTFSGNQALGGGGGSFFGGSIGGGIDNFGGATLTVTVPNRFSMPPPTLPFVVELATLSTMRQSRT